MGYEASIIKSVGWIEAHKVPEVRRRLEVGVDDEALMWNSSAKYTYRSKVKDPSYDNREAVERLLLHGGYLCTWSKNEGRLAIGGYDGNYHDTAEVMIEFLSDLFVEDSFLGWQGEGGEDLWGWRLNSLSPHPKDGALRIPFRRVEGHVVYDD